jgi:hypothetical protein
MILPVAQLAYELIGILRQDQAVVGELMVVRTWRPHGCDVDRPVLQPAAVTDVRLRLRARRVERQLHHFNFLNLNAGWIHHLDRPDWIRPYKALPKSMVTH